MAPAKTGSERSNRIEVIITAHTNRGTRSIRNPLLRMFITVAMKFTDPRIEEMPAKCSEKIAISTEGPACAILPARGG